MQQDKSWWARALRTPCCGRGVLPRASVDALGLPVDGELTCETCGTGYPVLDGVVRFAGGDEYADSFGVQWDTFGSVQIDHLNGVDASRRRLELIAGGSLDLFAGALVYEAGSGAGRYSAVVAAAGGNVVAADLAHAAINACRRNTRGIGQVLCVHADGRRPPVAPASVDVALSVGVYQHTPDPLAYVTAVADTVREGGTLVLWGYERRLRSLAHPKYVLRPLSRRVPPVRLLELIRRATPALLDLSRAARRLPAGSALARLVPVADPAFSMDLPLDQARAWAALDTFDWLSPRYDRPRRFATVRKTLEQAGFEVTRVLDDSVSLVATRSP